MIQGSWDKEVEEMGILKTLKEIRRVKKNMTLSREEVLQIQREKLHALIEYVLKNSKFYRDYYDEHGITLDNYRDVDFSDYPSIDKSMVRENFDDIICTDKFNLKDLEGFLSDKEETEIIYKGHVVMTSSGSTGQPAIFIYDTDAWATVKAFIAGRVDPTHKLSLLKKERAAFLIAKNEGFASYSLALEAGKIGYETLILDVNEPFENIVQAIVKFKPKILSGYSSSISLLAEENLKRNLNISPERVYCSADKLTRDKRAIIKKSFGINPLDFYGATESLGMGTQLMSGEKLFLFEDYYRFDILNDELKEVEPGEIGKLTVTNLYNYVMPLLKYKMEDRLKKSESQDHIFTLIDEVVGRTVDDLYFKMATGDYGSVNGVQLASNYVQGVKKIQYIQEDENTLRIKYVYEGLEDPGVRILDLMKKMLTKKKLEKDVRIKLEAVEKIPVDERTGKFKQIIPYRNKR